MSQIAHVSDTALMVAACRASETERPDGFVRDPFAARLAGEKGAAITQNASGFDWLCFAIGVRSRFIDDLVLGIVNSGAVTAVLSLGAGLDTRPWRLDLPSTLRWIEVDFPHMLDYKMERLAGTTPRCHRDQISADLTIESEREHVFTCLGNAPTLMITEGLLMYLHRQAIYGIAAASHHSSVASWICDFTSSELSRRMQGDLFRQAQNVRSEDHLAGEEIRDSITSEGWRQTKFFSYTKEAVEIGGKRLMELVGASPRPPEPVPPGDPSGVHLFEKHAWSAVGLGS